MNIIQLELRAIDFKNTIFTTPFDCAISKAFKRQIGIKEHERLTEEIDVIYIYNDIEHTTEVYKHIWYGQSYFIDDMDIAKQNNFSPDFIVRTIELQKF